MPPRSRSSCCRWRCSGSSPSSTPSPWRPSSCSSSSSSRARGAPARRSSPRGPPRSYSYYFLPPAGFGIENPNDWVAFVTFTGTAIIVGELSARAERRHIEAQEGRREIERLYQELQAAFERASEAEAARRNEQLKAALLDALTHNLRTPLTAIKAAVTALMGAGRPGQSRLSSEGEHELLEVIDEESDRLNRFIEGLVGGRIRRSLAAAQFSAGRPARDRPRGAGARRRVDARSSRRRDHRR